MRKLVLTAMVLMMFAATAVAKTGMINFQYVYDKSDAGKAANTQLGNKAKEYEEKLKELGETIQQNQKELEAQASMLSEEGRVRKQDDLNAKIRDFNAQRQDYQKRLQRLQSKLSKDVQDEVLEIVKNLGEEKGYDLIVEFKEAGVLYFDEAVNISDEVIDRYNKVWNAKK